VSVGYRWETEDRADGSVEQPAEPAAEPAEGARGDAPADAPAADAAAEVPAPAPFAGRANGSAVTDPNGSAPRGDRAVRLWLGGSAVQRLRRGAAWPRSGGARRAGFALQVRCRPGCALSASAEVRTGRRVRRLGGRALGAVRTDRGPARVAFTLSAREQRWLVRELRRGRVAVKVTVRATAPGHGEARAVRTVTLRR
jgi:hypothetical protein